MLGSNPELGMSQRPKPGEYQQRRQQFGVVSDYTVKVCIASYVQIYNCDTVHVLGLHVDREGMDQRSKPRRAVHKSMLQLNPIRMDVRNELGSNSPMGGNNKANS